MVTLPRTCRSHGARLEGSNTTRMRSLCMMTAVMTTKVMPRLMAPQATVARGPMALPIHPTTGETSGVPPMTSVAHRLMTRPRMCGVTEVCTMALAVMRVEMAPHPTNILSTAKMP